jgi:hypothetical protein
MTTKKFLLLCLVLSATTANAGSRTSYEVFIYDYNPDNSYAFGSFAAAYNSADSNQSMYCTLKTEFYSPGGYWFDYLECGATDAAGKSGWCSLSSPSQALKNLVLAITETSAIEFHWDSAHTCTALTVQRISTQIPQTGTTSTATSTMTATSSKSTEMRALFSLVPQTPRK